MSYTVYVGGTFNVLHEGHRKLLRKAVECMGEFRHLEVGVTASAWAKRDVPVRNAEWRRQDVLHYLTDELGVRPDRIEFTIISSDCPVAMVRDLDATDILVCSTETEQAGRRCLSRVSEDVRPRLVVVSRDRGMRSSTDIIKEDLAHEYQ